MNKEIILKEGFFDKLKALLKKDPKFMKNVKDMNKIAKSLEDRLNKRAVARGEKGNIKLHRFKPSDFIKSKR